MQQLVHECLFYNGPKAACHLCRPFVDSRNKGPHFWDESKPFEAYTNIYSLTAERALALPEGETLGEVTADASSNTFSVSGVQIRGNHKATVRALPLPNSFCLFTAMQYH